MENTTRLLFKPTPSRPDGTVNIHVGDNRIQRDDISTVAPAENLDEIYDANVKRLALFAQDEWDVSSTWSAYTGLRWEGLETLSEGNSLAAVQNRSDVFSPIFQSLWKVPGTQGDQVRLGIARTYKAPSYARPDCAALSLL